MSQDTGGPLLAIIGALFGIFVFVIGYFIAIPLINSIVNQLNSLYPSSGLSNLSNNVILQVSVAIVIALVGFGIYMLLVPWRREYDTGGFG